MKFHPKNVDYFVKGLITRDELIQFGEKEYIFAGIGGTIIDSHEINDELTGLEKALEVENSYISEVIKLLLDE